MFARRSILLVGALALLACTCQATEGQPIPPEIASNTDQWPLPNGNYANTRSAVDSTLSSRTVNQLRVSWNFEITTSPHWFSGAAATSPLILDDTVFLQDINSNVFAIDVATGEVHWEQLHRGRTLGPNGVTVAWGKVFGISGPRSITALDKANGASLWTASWPNQGGLPPPIPFDGAVYAGIGTNVTGVSGSVRALDPETGQTLWTFRTMLSPDAWGHPDINFGGNVWYPPAIDTQRGIVYAGVGNPYPFPGTATFPNGSSRPGDNLYTNSLLALDHRTGELLWFNQPIPHDIFDHDFSVPPVLATVNIAGTDRDIVIGGGKAGRVLAFDRDTGQTLWDTPVGVHLNDDLTELPPGPTIVYPGALGGVVTPMAYADGVVYAPVANRGDRFSPTAMLNRFTEAVGPITGELTAIDAATGAILWSTEFDAMALGGATVVNDLVFTSTLDGVIYALDRATGREVWRYQAPGGINAWPAVAGDTIVFPVGFGDVPQLIAFHVPEPMTHRLVALGILSVLTFHRKHRRRSAWRHDATSGLRSFAKESLWHMQCTSRDVRP